MVAVVVNQESTMSLSLSFAVVSIINCAIEFPQFAHKRDKFYARAAYSHNMILEFVIIRAHTRRARQKPRSSLDHCYGAP